MPYTKKQKRFFQAVAHGMKPKKGKLSKSKARAILATAEREGYAAGGAIRGGGLEALTGRGRARPSLASNRALGPRLGAISASPTVARTPTSAKRSGRGGGLEVLTGRARSSSSNGSLRPRPGRGVNAKLALAGTEFHEAADRLSQIRKNLRR